MWPFTTKQAAPPEVKSLADPGADIEALFAGVVAGSTSISTAEALTVPAVSDHYDAEARLVILKALAGEMDYRLSDSMLVTMLEAFAIKRGRDYVRTQLRWLQSSAGAIRLTEAGSAMIAQITEAGLDHVEFRRILEGVKRPSPSRSA